MIAMAVVSVLLFWFVAEYEFVTVVGTASSTAPDRKRTIVIESKIHKSLFRQFRTVESTIFMSNGATGMIHYHWLGPPQTESSDPPDLELLGSKAITWGSDSKTVTYHITDNESATIWLTGNPRRKTEVHRHDSPK